MCESFSPMQSTLWQWGLWLLNVTMDLILQNSLRGFYDKVHISSINDSVELRRGQCANTFIRHGTERLLNLEMTVFSWS